MSTLSLNSVSFAKLSVTDRNKLLQQFKEKSLAALDADLKASGLPPEQIYAERTVFVASRWGYGRFCQMLDDFDGQESVLRTGLKNANPGKTDADLDDLMKQVTSTPDEVVKFVCELTGVPWAPPTRVPLHMKQIGTVDGKAVFVAIEQPDKPADGETEGGDEANPTETVPPKRRGYGT